MAFESTTWKCGHTGEIQLYGPMTSRKSRLAYEAGRKCMACWLLEQWQTSKDARATMPNAFNLAIAIAGSKRIRIRTGVRRDNRTGGKIG